MRRNRQARCMALPCQQEIGVRLGCKSVFGDFLDTVDQVSTRGALDQGLGVGRTELEVDNNVSL